MCRGGVDVCMVSVLYIAARGVELCVGVELMCAWVLYIAARGV